MELLGWILDLYPKDGQMIVWLKSPDGSYRRLADSGWQPAVYVSAPLDDLLNLAYQPFIAGSKLIEKFVNPGDSKRTRVLKVDVKSETQAATLAKIIQRYGNYSKFRLFNVDVPFTQMYLYAKDLFPLALVQARPNSDGVHWLLKDSREDIDYELPPFKKIRLRVRTDKTSRVQRFNDELDSIDNSKVGLEKACREIKEQLNF